MMIDAAVGVDIGGTKLAVGLVAPDGSLLNRIIEPVETDRAEAPVFQAARLARQLLSDAVPAGVGVGIPGLPELFGKGAWAPNLPGWENLPLKALLRQAFGDVPIATENDGKCAALGEAWAGAGRGVSSAVLITIGTGLGGGVVLDGRLLPGFHGVAGTFGWIPVPDEPLLADRPPMNGPLEWLEAGPGLNRAAAATGFADARALFQAARQGNPAAEAEVTRFADRLARAISTITSVVDPELVILGGGVSADFAVFEAPLAKALRRHLHPFATHVRVVPAELGSDAGLIGAARLVLPNSKEVPE